MAFWRHKIYLNTLLRLKPDHFSFLFYRYHKLFYRSLIFRGRKIWAANFFIQVKFLMKKALDFAPSHLFLMSLISITPNVLLMPLKLGGLIEQVALPITSKKKIIYGVKWAIKLLRDKNRVITVNSIANNLISALSGKGISIDEKRKIYSIANKNRYLVRFFN